MPHVLVAGTTGSGKSGCVNAILSSILMHASPNDVRLVLVDPKQVELNHYEHVPHLLTPVVTSPRLAANVLANLIGEMESRYGIMGQARCRNLAELNRARAKAGEAPLPHILCVIDELADLMMVSPAEVEDSIIRLAQKSRATGIHLVLATQRPSTDIITGTIKVNIPARIAFAVSSQTDSRVILDQGGAEALLGQGDMLFRGAGTSKMARVQGAFVTEEEIARITGHWAKQGEPEFEAELLEVARGGRRRRRRRRLRSRRRRPARRGDPHRRADRNRFRLDDPAPPARRLHPRRAADRHARAARRDLRLRGLQAAAGADHRGRPVRACSPPAATPSRSRSTPTTPVKRRSFAPERRSGHNVGVDTGIGATLREARNRRKIELSEVEAAIKIRVRYLQAIENEEWDALPGGAYTRGFIRTYAYYLGLDGERLADDYRRGAAPPGGERVPKRVEPVPTGARRGRAPPLRSRSRRRRLPGARRPRGRDRPRRRRRRHAVLLTASSAADRRRCRRPMQRRKREASSAATVAQPGVAVRLAATAEVWVCLLDAGGEPLVDGEILAAGRRSRPVSLRRLRNRPRQRLGGRCSSTTSRPRFRQAPAPWATGSTADGELIALEEGERPDCE